MQCIMRKSRNKNPHNKVLQKLQWMQKIKTNPLQFSLHQAFKQMISSILNNKINQFSHKQLSKAILCIL